MYLLPLCCRESIGYVKITGWSQYSIQLSHWSQYRSNFENLNECFSIVTGSSYLQTSPYIPESAYDKIASANSPQGFSVKTYWPKQTSRAVGRCPFHYYHDKNSNVNCEILTSRELSLNLNYLRRPLVCSEITERCFHKKVLKKCVKLKKVESRVKMMYQVRKCQIESADVGLGIHGSILVSRLLWVSLLRF